MKGMNGTVAGRKASFHAVYSTITPGSPYGGRLLWPSAAGVISLQSGKNNSKAPRNGFRPASGRLDLIGRITLNLTRECFS
jgi:hypothetical protein